MPDEWWPPQPKWSRTYPGFGALWRFRGWLHFWRRRPEVRFGFRFALGSVLASLVYVGSAPRLAFVQTATAAASASTLSAMGIESFTRGSVVAIGGRLAYDVTLGCTAVFIGLLFLTAVVAYPSGWRAKVPAIALGIPLLLLCNLVRLVTMGWVGVHAPFLYESMHFVYWQALLVLFVSVGFFAWTRWLEPRDAPALPRPRRAARLVFAGALFLAVVSSLWMAGLWWGGVKGYGRSLFFVVTLLQRAWLGHAAAIHSESMFFSLFVYDYAAAITLMALFAASIHVPLRRRLVGFAWALPATFLLQAVTWAVQLRSQGSLNAWQGSFLYNTRLMVLPFFAWLLWMLAWSRRQRAQEPASTIAE